MIENVVVHLPAVRRDIDQLIRVDAGQRAAGDVADVVAAAALIDDADILQAHEHVDRILRADFANLEVGAGGHMGIAATIGLGQIGHRAELV